MFYEGAGKLLNMNGLEVMVFNATFNNTSVISWQSCDYETSSKIKDTKHVLYCSFSRLMEMKI